MYGNTPLGARVVATTSTEEKAATCQSLGADLVVNYRSDNISKRLHEYANNGANLWWETSRSPQIDQIVPLAETPAMHRRQEENTIGEAGTLRGKIVVRL